MNAATYGAQVTIDERSYFFESVKVYTDRKLETTPLVDGGLYRHAAGAQTVCAELKARIQPFQMGGYLLLIRGLVTGLHAVEINDMTFSSMALISGRLYLEEGKDFASVELKFSEANGI